jgi:hypothetical protein
VHACRLRKQTWPGSIVESLEGIAKRSVTLLTYGARTEITGSQRHFSENMTGVKTDRVRDGSSFTAREFALKLVGLATSKGVAVPRRPFGPLNALAKGDRLFRTRRLDATI